MKIINSPENRFCDDHSITSVPGDTYAEDVLIQLEDIMKDLDRERAAIESSAIDQLNDINDEIDLLLQKVAQALQRGAQFSNNITELLEGRIREVLLQRKSNHDLAEKVFLQISASIKANAVHRQAVSAYHPTQQRNELFLKKDC